MITSLRNLLRDLACALLSGIAVLIGLTLVAAALPSDMAPGNAAARDRDHRDDDDDRSRADRDRHHGFKDFSIEVLSGRPDMIAGGDALVRVSVKEKDVRLRDVAIRLNGAKVTRSFLVDHTTPIIDYRGYNDRLAEGDIHLRYHSFSMRERLKKANGRYDNQIIVIEDNGFSEDESPLARRMLLAMDRWITAVEADKRRIPQIEKVVRNKPADLQEGCNTRDLNNPTFIAQKQVRDLSTTCAQLYPTNSFPREVAGANIAADIIKCETKRLRQSDYNVSFTPQQWARLQAIFPTGVCDWSRRGEEQQDLKDTWIAFD
jgi:hypothetical protein